MELRADPRKRDQHQRKLLQQLAQEEKKRKHKLFVIYFSAGLSFLALCLIGFVAYKIAFAPTEYQFVPPSPSGRGEAVKTESHTIVVEGKTYDSVQAFLDRDTEPSVPIPRDDLPAGTIAE